MKKTLLLLSILGASLLGLATVSAQYYGNTTTNTSYGSSYSYGQNYNNYNGGTGSYTIGCTTYYYNTRTGAQLSTQNICTNYQYQQETTYYYPTTTYYEYYTQPTYQYQYSYPYYDYGYVGGNYGSQYGNGSSYCTYQYVNGGWYGCGW